MLIYFIVTQKIVNINGMHSNKNMFYNQNFIDKFFNFEEEIWKYINVGVKNLTKSCLQSDPLLRPSSKQLLEHTIFFNKDLPHKDVIFYG